ncbi:MAG: alpha/beta hydrolase domain-containing protein [Hyphomicrobiaceae bacterium]
MTNKPTLDIRTRYVLAGGHSFGEAGRYERIDGRARLQVDPKAPAQAGIVDLEHAPRDSSGFVTFETDVQLLKPVDPARADGRLLVELVNRGNKRCLQFFNDAPGTNDPKTLAHCGNGFLMRRGYAVCWIAWQGDILPGDGRILLDLPVAREDGRPITGSVRSEFIADTPGLTTFPLSGWVSTRSHPAVSLDTRKAHLVRRRYPGEAPEAISPDAWSFARVEGGSGLDNQGAERAVVASDIHIHVPGGFEPGWIYELVYEGRDPLVLGLGHVAVRDVTSFLRYDTHDAAGTPNPLAEGGKAIEKVYGWGRSQTGRCLRDFVYQGFNADAKGRRVFDGILPHVSGAGLMWMNHRFASAVRPAGQEYEDRLNPADRFPFSYARSTDHFTGKADAILKRPETDPLVLHTQSSTEYWQRRGSLVHTDTKGNDLPLPDTVRAYLWSSSQHFADPLLKVPSRGFCRETLNVVGTSMLFRAMLDCMDAWASAGTPPPDSRIPRRADGTLVTMADWQRQFPAIPGVMRPRGPATLPRFDWGAEFERGILAEPPREVPGESYTVLVPSVDADGNETAGVRAPMAAAPLATYTGWNIRARGHGHGAMHTYIGSTIPFADTEGERAQTGDPRRSIAERYGTVETYVAAIRRAAEQLVAERLMIAEDVERCVAAAAGWSTPRHDARLSRTGPVLAGE